MAAILKNLDFIQNDVMEYLQPKYNVDIFYMTDPKTGTGKKPKGSGRRLYTDENPKDTIPIKFSTLKDVKDTISKLEKLYKGADRPHVRISQVANLLEQRLRFLVKKKSDPRYKLAKRYTDFLKERTKLKTFPERKLMTFSLST